tara:strand:- start:210 stop:581 length:372 start_codon:yes stop_codon:yes gene_type:complete
MVTHESHYEGGHAFFTAGGGRGFEISISAIPIGKNVTIRFYGKSENDGYGYLYVNSNNVNFSSIYSNCSSFLGNANWCGDFSNDTWYQYTYSFTTWPITSTFKWIFEASSNVIGYIDKIEILW